MYKNIVLFDRKLLKIYIKISFLLEESPENFPF